MEFHSTETLNTSVIEPTLLLVDEIVTASIDCYLVFIVLVMTNM